MRSSDIAQNRCIFGTLGVKFIFPIFFEEILHAAMWLKPPKG
jgi:hypothetical protein